MINLAQGYTEIEAENFYNGEYPHIYRYALYLVRDEEKAREFCQEAFIRWFEAPNNKQIINPRAWLKKVLSNLVYSDFRYRKSRAGMELRLQDGYVATRGINHTDMLRIEVQDVLERLKWKDQVLLKMRMAGMSYAEIAEALDISIGSVGTLLVRAMRRFRLEYEGKEAGKKDDMPGRHSTFNVSRG